MSSNLSLTRSIKALQTKREFSSRFKIQESSNQTIVNSPMVLLPYQQKWALDDSPVKVWEKSRRIGASWCEAGIAALEASKVNGKDTYYLAYNKEMTQGFINDCADWAKHYNLACSDIEEVVLNDEDDDIIAYRVTFASGHIIQALSSKPRSLRSKGSVNTRLVIDEMGFVDDPEGLMASAMAYRIWGNSISILSTHNGKKSYFNQMIKAIHDGELPYSLHKTTIEDALNDGLYQRICLVNGEEWSKEKEEKWLQDLIFEYGIAASQELYCIPDDYSTIKYISQQWFKITDKYNVPYCDRVVRAYDIAASEYDAGTKKREPCRTAGVLMGYSTYTDTYVIFDTIAEMFNPSQVDDLMLSTAHKDGKNVWIVSEGEPGASGIRDAEHIKNLLREYMYTNIKAQGDKLVRARAFASAVKNGRVLIVRGDNTDDYLAEIDSVPNERFDYLDASSLAFNFLNDSNVLASYMVYLEE